jgi:phage-related protein
MKCAIIVLFALVAVSQAAFTANLVQRAQPAISQAMFKVRLASRSSDLQTPLAQQLQEHLNDLLNQVQSGVHTAQNTAAGLVSEIQATIQQLTAMGSNVLENGQQIVGNFWDNLMATLFGKGRNFSLNGFLSSVQTTVGAYINDLLAQVQSVVAQINLPQLLQHAVSQVLGLVGLQGRNVFSDAWTQVQSLGSQAWASLQSVVSNITTAAGSAFDQISTLAQDFLSEASNEIHTITSQAATEFLAFLKPYQQDLGALYTNVANQISSLISSV